MKRLYGEVFTDKQIKAINKLLIKVKINNIMDFSVMLKCCKSIEELDNDLMDCITNLERHLNE